MGRKNIVNNSKDEGVNNSLVTATETPGQTATNDVEDTTQQTGTDEWLTEKLTPYFDAYPNEKLFHITSDGQVFLEKSHNDAVNHQRLYDHTKKVVSFERE
jgi:hypothetical protein